MILADTSVWVDFLRRKEPLYSKLLRQLEEREVWAAEPVFAELLQGARNIDEFEIIKGYWEHLPRISSQNLLVEAGEQSRKNRWLSGGVGLIDAAIIVAARREGARIWTLDSRLKKVLGKDEQYG
jgi:predicted nucleic acid-binding protein